MYDIEYLKGIPMPTQEIIDATNEFMNSPEMKLHLAQTGLQMMHEQAIHMRNVLEEILFMTDLKEIHALIERTLEPTEASINS